MARSRDGETMTEQTEVEAFCAELRAFCEARGYEIAGTCESEGIYGEITVIKVGAESGWRNWDKNKFNFEVG
jgi:hypothetical protein